jgi:hypothetical protein
VLIEQGSHLFAYAITRDFGFAPNPFHGLCTLATCKPGIRKTAKIGDWVMGLGGSQLGLVKSKCILLMKVSEKISFQKYWEDPRFTLKKPSRNGSRVQMLGDNIYHKDDHYEWIQEDSHHSNFDGSSNSTNLARDTGNTDQVLMSDYFLYFGNQAVGVDLESIEYRKIRNYKKINLSTTPNAQKLIKKILSDYRVFLNLVTADPCQFMDSHQRVDQGTGKLS